MRSSVSVILSNPPPDTTMSYPDYCTSPHHHQTLLVLVRQVGSQLKSRSFHKLYDRISRVGQVKVSDSNGSQRPVWVTYRRDYPVENNDWGDFQTHRRVLGIITIGQVGSQSDLNDICKQHESLKVKYSSTLYDSRCIILGLNPDGTMYEADSRGPSRGTSPEPNGGLDSGPHPLAINGHTHPTHVKKISAGSTDRDSGVYETVSGEDKPTDSDSHSDSPQGLSEGTTDLKIEANHVNGSDSGSESTSEVGCCDDNKIDSPRDSTADSAPDSSHDSAHDTSQSSISTSTSHSSRLSLQPPSNFKTRALFYPTGDHAVNIESQLQEFVSSLFWVLESKRLDKSQEKLERPPLLCAPFERKDFIGLDMDSRTNKKRCVGRLRKQLADLTLQAGLPTEAIMHYSHAADTLRNCNDWLWLAACFEGLCAASVVTLYPNLRRSFGLQRFSSLGVGGNLGGSGGIGNRSRNGSVNTNSLPAGLDPSIVKQTSKHCLSPDDIVDKYREAIVHYSKYRNAGVVETEASIKAVHVLIEQRRYLMAAEFLSNVVFINLQLSDEEKCTTLQIARFNALADLYHQIGFHRKASFFRRVAAMRCVAPQNQQPDWGQCYRLLLQTLEGYKVCLDPLEFRKDGSQGWPSLQIQILQELVGTSRRMGQHALCTRHQAFLVCAMLPHLSETERQETATMLESLSARSGSGPAPLVVQETGIIIPPVNFLNIPVCRKVRLIAPATGRKAEKKLSLTGEEDTGPFIFSPFTSLTSINERRTNGKMEFDWVEGDVCEICLDLENPMPFELKVTNMMLITEGAQFESWASTTVLKPEKGLQSVTIRGRPQSAGELRVIGYSSTVMGVSSNCRLKFMSQLKMPQYSVNVVPALPLIQILTGNCSTGSLGVERPVGEECGNLHLSLSAGETHECSVVLHNLSSQPVEELTITLESKMDKELLNQVFQYSEENIHAQLPIPPGGKASLTLYVYAVSDFLCPGRLDESLETTSMISGSEPPSLISGGPSSLPSRQSAATSSTRGARTRRTDSSASLLSSRSGSSVRSGSSSSTQAPSSTIRTRATLNTPGCTGRTLDATLMVKYSGGSGMSADFCRSTQLTINIEVTPSLLVTRWDVLPAELPHQCYVVLDLLNCASHEMDLHYTPTKHILIEAGDSCRVPVPVDRCPLATLTQDTNMSESGWGWSTVLGGHVASLVELRWTLGPSDTPGRASLAGITFPPSTHDLITMAPIHWDVQVDGQDVVGGTENSGVVGRTLELNVGITNTSGAPLPPLSLRLTAFQDHQNGHLNYRLEAKMTTTGATKLTTPQLAEGEEFQHCCGLVFFTAGVYKVEVTCSPAAAVAQASFYENVTPAHQHAWKFAPPLEITITDV
ncbi:protein brunelleschi-like isoform X1 [Homarus americanus]|uniref:protein brunelleschi-like isoform X1 n=1 Tax=Homarus americanus TaxID=6706 RepID=UPI001C47403A|nr:protein brunelleschi-like isoform X1 [Homarus americanus]XP_042221046.1 protein brunelleschi-like isoform X1 [Homarus americanus]XP_042221047.1 protein brunelleschi-like isoform X1 [Homarus americanus]XP_042221048.1 protein brunelleschi-like isoform X1 [Homarus americanus]XP_042221049.1 protein brunelleschi-like isoform X1 [Homarus americanus]XP_042221050.1 protein brunelleschi-like isoform X1 [Homarus americanus]